jgi:hypothetical protein
MAGHDLGAVAFPALDQARMASAARCPSTKLGRYRDGETLFEASDHGCKFDVVKSAEAEIRDETGRRMKIHPSWTVMSAPRPSDCGDAASR